MRRTPLALLLALAVTAGGCSTVYYAAMAQLGWARHDLLAERVQQARDSQDQARLQFADALPLFTAAGGPAVGANRLAALRASHDDCADSAALVRTRIAAVETAADAFFGEWNEELGEATGANRARDQQRYDMFRLHYDRLLAAMRDAEAAMPPVLAAMQAQVTALESGQAATPPGASAGDPLVRKLQLAVALADQYIAELESID